MFDHADNPDHLLDSLIAFVKTRHGYVLPRWYGISAEKLSSVRLPRPLARLYGSLGNMPGFRDWPFPFAQQDYLLPFEFLSVERGRLLFAVENQGVWRAYTEPIGDDPPVWIVTEEDRPEIAHPSLANFLATLCLQELSIGCPILYAGEELIRKLEAAGHRVNPLWLEGLFPLLDQLRKPTFHLADGRHLLYDDGWIGFSNAEEAAAYAPVLEQARRIHPPQKTESIAKYLAGPDRNPLVVRLHFESLARAFQAQADSLKAKADECRRLALGDDPA
jgi:hypothetical protein